MAAWLTAALAVLVSADPALYALEADTSVWDVAARDVNGDGTAEVFALCCDEDARPLKKSVGIYFADEAGAYPARPTISLDLDPRIGALFFAETDGAPPAELVAAHAEGATVYGFPSGRPEPIASVAFTSLWPSGAREPKFLRHAAMDVDGDGIDEWLVPVPSGYEVRTVDGRRCMIACDIASEIYSGETVLVSHRLPACRLFDMPGQTEKGLAFLSDEVADFFYGPNWSEHRQFRIPINLEEKWDAHARMEDIDGNGVPDLLVTQTQGMVQLKVLTQVYLATTLFTYPETPSATFETNGAVTTPLLKDVDGDGQRDLVFITVPLGLKSLVNYFVRKKLSVVANVHLFDGAGFPDKPTFHANVTLDAPEGRQQVVSTLGDFNGDGRLDIAYGQRADRLAVLLGDEKQFMSARPWTTLRLPTFGEARTNDLNGDGRDDIVLFHPAGDQCTRIDVIVF